AADWVGDVVAWEAADHKLVVWGAPDDDVAGGAPPIEFPAPAYSAPSITVAYGAIVGGEWGLEVAVQGANNHLDVYDRALCADGYQPTTWDPCRTPGSVDWTWSDPSGGTAYSQPSLVQANNASLLAVEGPNHSLQFYWQAE